MPPTPADPVASPDRYLHSFEGDAAVFVGMDRAAYHRSIFLDGRIAPPPGAEVTRVAAAGLERDMPARQSTGWIFHVAHCGSTLLARALDRPEGNLVLREPLALRQLALAPDERRLGVVAAMLSRRYQPGLRTIVKANVPVNFMLDRLAALDPRAPAILLHMGLRDWLLAILRSEGHRTWLGNVTRQLATHLGAAAVQDDAERAAMLWAAQTGAFAAALGRMPNARSLDAEHLFGNPRDAVGAAARHLEVAMPGDALDGIIAGPLFSTYSKNPGVAFDNEARLARRRDLEGELAGEIGRAEAWIERFAPDVDAGSAAIAAARIAD